MLEYHAWVTLRESPREVDEGNLNRIVAEIRRELADWDSFNPKSSLQPVNGTYFLTVTGSANHLSSHIERCRRLLELVAKIAPGSYGLFYVWDDEDPAHANEFRVWVLARGTLQPRSDPFLSPCIPTFEDPYRE